VQTSVARRPTRQEWSKTFCVGDREFDPGTVGLSATCNSGTSLLDTRVWGNWNTGRWFTGPDSRDTTKPKDGVIGRKLKANKEERAALIAYLKTL